MDYSVVLTDSAKADADSIYDWVVKRAPMRGPTWFDELMDSLASLGNNPYRCPLAREAKKAGRGIRSLVFGKRRYAYRVLFEIDAESHMVRVLHIRRGTRRDIKA